MYSNSIIDLIKIVTAYSIQLNLVQHAFNIVYFNTYIPLNTFISKATIKPPSYCIMGTHVIIFDITYRY